jgi:AcrR family transcriptional regulator
MLDAAERTFSAVGVHAASMDRIAREAGISKPMLYNYFGSKEGLYLASLSRAGGDLARRLRDAEPPDGSVRDRLLAGVTAFFGYVDEQRAAWSVLREELARQGEPLGGELTTLRANIVALITELFVTTAADPGEEERERLDAFAWAFVGAGESLADWWLDHPGVPLGFLTGVLMGMADSELPASS